MHLFKEIWLNVHCLAIDMASRFISYAGAAVYSMSFVDSVKHEAKSVSVSKRRRKITTMFRRG